MSVATIPTERRSVNVSRDDNSALLTGAHKTFAPFCGSQVSYVRFLRYVNPLVQFFVSEKDHLGLPALQVSMFRLLGVC